MANGSMARYTVPTCSHRAKPVLENINYNRGQHERGKIGDLTAKIGDVIKLFAK
jgi:hypothetical protein